MLRQRRWLGGVPVVAGVVLLLGGGRASGQYYARGSGNHWQGRGATVAVGGYGYGPRGTYAATGWAGYRGGNAWRAAGFGGVPWRGVGYVGGGATVPVPGYGISWLAGGYGASWLGGPYAPAAPYPAVASYSPSLYSAGYVRNCPLAFTCPPACTSWAGLLTSCNPCSFSLGGPLLCAALSNLSDYEYAQPPAQGATPVSLDVSEPVAPETVANLDIVVPADAEVWIGGRKSAQTGPRRYYRSPPLAAGTEYSYTVRARWLEGGQRVEQTRVVRFRAGTRLVVELDTPRVTPTGGVAQASR